MGRCDIEVLLKPDQRAAYSDLVSWTLEAHMSVTAGMLVVWTAGNSRHLHTFTCSLQNNWDPGYSRPQVSPAKCIKFVHDHWPHASRISFPIIPWHMIVSGTFRRGGLWKIHYFVNGIHSHSSAVAILHCATKRNLICLTDQLITYIWPGAYARGVAGLVPN